MAPPDPRLGLPIGSSSPTPPSGPQSARGGQRKSVTLDVPVAPMSARTHKEPARPRAVEVPESPESRSPSPPRGTWTPSLKVHGTLASPGRRAELGTPRSSLGSARSYSSDASGLFAKPAWDVWQQEKGRVVPEVKIFFQNSHYAATAPKQHELPIVRKLPEEIDFYVTTKSCGAVPYPLPSYYPHRKYLHTAETKTGYENAGPVFSLPLDPEHIIGLKWHQIADHGFTAPLVVHIPVTKKTNRTLRAQVTTVHIPTITHLGINQPIVRVSVHSMGLEPLRRRWWLKLKEYATHIMTVPEKDQPRFKRIAFGFNSWKRTVITLTRLIGKRQTALEMNRAAGQSIHVAGDKMNKHPIGTPYRMKDRTFPRAALEVQGGYNFFFQNVYIAHTAPKPSQLKPHQLLPREIYFYIRINTSAVRYPFPPDVNEEYLHVARIMPGHESGGPSLCLELNPSTIVGLKPHHMNKEDQPKSSIQLVLEVPSTAEINPGVEPTAITFNPQCAAQLHRSKLLPRIIIPARPMPVVDDADKSSRNVNMDAGEVKVRVLRGLLASYDEMPRRQATIKAWQHWIRYWEDTPLP